MEPSRLVHNEPVDHSPPSRGIGSGGSPTVAFWPHTTDLAVASTRIRCSSVVRGLSEQGCKVSQFAPGAEAPDILVLSKRYDPASLTQVEAMRSRYGTRLVLDLCDNHFHAKDPSPHWRKRADTLRDAVRRVDRVVAASPTLAEVIRREAPGCATVSVICDALDDSGGEPRPTFKDGWGQALLRWFQWQHPAPIGRRLLWFGNHGSSYADGGMQDLSRIADALHRHHREARLSLTVLSNSAAAYKQLTRGWNVPTLYLPWSAPLFRRAAALHAVAVIPAQLNPFTSCKTNNRLATAFSHGLGVAADPIPSYREFADCAVLDDWHSGLGALMADAGERSSRIERARQRLNERYALDEICAQWASLFGELMSSRAGGGGRPAVRAGPAHRRAG